MLQPCAAALHDIAGGLQSLKDPSMSCLVHRLNDDPCDGQTFVGIVSSLTDDIQGGWICLSLRQLEGKKILATINSARRSSLQLYRDWPGLLIHLSAFTVFAVLPKSINALSATAMACCRQDVSYKPMQATLLAAEWRFTVVWGHVLKGAVSSWYGQTSSTGHPFHSV